MKVEVVSREFIGPSSPTPESLREYKLSLVDQLALNFKTLYVFFYDSAVDSGTRCTELKKSLSRALSLMYPLAGRLREDRATVECNDEGVEFIEAVVDEKMCSVVDDPDTDVVRELVPSGPGTGAYEPSPVGKALLVIQVNRFSCGGMAIGSIFSHGIADAVSTVAFFKAWATITRGGTVDGNGYIFDSSRIFPPVNATGPIEQLARVNTETAEKKRKYAVRRFVFPASAVAQLKEQLRIGDRPPSRTEALTAFVWAAVIRATPETTLVHEVSSIVNLRGRVNPLLPPNCLGNLVSGNSTRWEGSGNVDPRLLVGKIRDSIRVVNDGFVRMKFSEGGYVRALLARGVDELLAEKQKADSYCLHTSSLCGLAVYDVDFGTGKPRWVADPTLLRDFVIFIDSKDGGVEAWVGLPKEIMNMLLQDRHFLGYLSGFPKSKL